MAANALWGQQGYHAKPDFKKAVADAPGWVPSGGVVDGELPTGAGRWLYR